MALVEGVQYGLSSQVQCKSNKTVIFVKLTDSAIRAIDDYVKLQHKAGRATLRFQGNEGNIRIPLSSSENGHSFDFSLSTNSDIEGPQGSFVCIQQNGPRSLESAGPLSYKMRIKANDDVFAQTQHRFSELEQKSRNECAKEIKSNCPDIGRKVKKKMGLAPIPQRREKSPSYISHQPQPKHPPPSNFANNSNSQKLPNGYSSNNVANNLNNRKIVNGLGTTNLNNLNGAGAPAPAGKNGIISGSQGISRRPLKERLIHMLAVKPYKKPELYQRLYSDGLKEREKKEFMQVLQQVANFKDNEYSLMRGVWNDVQEDWPFYSEQERQLMKRRKPQNLTPPGSDSSVGSGTSSLSPRSNCSIGSGHSPSSYSHSSSHYPPKASLSQNGSLSGDVKPTLEGGFESKGIKRPVELLPDNTDYGDIPPKKTRVSHFKRPGSGGSNSANHARPDNLAIKQEINGSSPQFPNNRITERLSPIASNNFHNGSNANGHHHRNGFEPMDVSPSHSFGGSNGYQSSSQGDHSSTPDESVTVGSTWQSRNGNHEHGFSDSEKPSRGDSDETDSIDSGNGSSTSGGSVGSQNNHGYSNTNGHSVNGRINVQNQLPVKPEISSSDNHLPNVNGCNRVSSTTSFHNTPQSSPDSQVDNLQKSLNIPIKSNQHQRSNGKFDSSVEIIVTRDKEKGNDRDSHRDRERNRRAEKDRLKEKERDRNKDRNKRNSDKKRSLENGDEIKRESGTEHEITSEYPSYLTRYTSISSPDQRTKYKEDFANEYPLYRELHAVIDKVSKRFAHLEERLRQEERGTDGYEKVKELIVNEYYANKRDKKYQETRQKFQYLHEKLSYIKRLVAEYDIKHQDQDVPS